MHSELKLQLSNINPAAVSSGQMLRCYNGPPSQSLQTQVHVYIV